MLQSEEIIKQIDRLYQFFRYSRSFVPYLNPDLAGQKTTANFNISKNVKSQIHFHEPLVEDFILFNNQTGHYLNQNFLIRLFALLDYHQIVSEKEKINAELPGSDEVDILRRLRKFFSHTSGSYNPDDTEKTKLAERIISHFNLQITDPNDFPISIDTVITPIVLKTKEYVIAKLRE